MRVDVGVNRFSLFLLLFCLVFIILFGCAPENFEDLIGVYEANYKIAKEKLILHENGSYLQIVYRKDTSRIDSSSGTWNYTIDNGWGVIQFNENYMRVMGAFYELNPDYAITSSKTNFGVTALWGNVKIEFHEGMYYRKIDGLKKD